VNARPPCRGRQAGITMTEVMIMSLVISSLMVVMAESMSTLSGVRVEQKAHFRVGDVAERVASRIRTDVHWATRVFSNSADDQEYLLTMAIGGSIVQQGGRLPSLTHSGYFQADAPGAPETGNVLLLAMRGPKVQLTFGDDATRLVQSLLFVVYASIDDGGRRDLLRWVSEPVVNYWDIVEIQDKKDRREAYRQLTDNGVRLAWDPYGKRATSLFEIDDDSLELVPPERRVDGREDRANSRPFRVRRMQFAANDSLPGVPVPAYANPASGFQGAFELKIDGASSGKLVLLRFVVASTEPLKRQIWTEIRRFMPTNG